MERDVVVLSVYINFVKRYSFSMLSENNRDDIETNFENKDKINVICNVSIVSRKNAKNLIKKILNLKQNSEKDIYIIEASIEVIKTLNLSYDKA